MELLSIVDCVPPSGLQWEIDPNGSSVWRSRALEPFQNHEDLQKLRTSDRLQRTGSSSSCPLCYSVKSESNRSSGSHSEPRSGSFFRKAGLNLWEPLSLWAERLPALSAEIKFIFDFQRRPSAAVSQKQGQHGVLKSCDPSPTNLRHF